MMQKLLVKFLLSTTVFSLLFLASCSNDEYNAVSPMLTVSITDANTNANPIYRTGDNITYNVAATVPSGVQIINYTKTIAGTVGAANEVSGVNPGDTEVNTTLTIPVEEAVGTEVTVTINIVANDGTPISATTTYTVAAEAATISIADANTNPNPSYENGDMITYRLTASIPAGAQAISGKKIVGGNESDLNLSYLVAAGDNSINTAFSVDVTENVGDNVTVEVTLTDATNQVVTTSATYTVAAVGQGGGGVAPLLSGTMTVSLGSQSASIGSYLATSTGNIYESNEGLTNQAVIDVTFGVPNSGQPSLISPDHRAEVGLFEGNPTMTAPRTTFFKAEANGPTDLSTVRALEVENNILASTSKVVQISMGNTYSFVQEGTTGKKGYIRVTNISGTGTNRTAEISFVVQQ